MTDCNIFNYETKNLIAVLKWLGLIVLQTFCFVPSRFEFIESCNSIQTPEILDLEVDGLQVQVANDIIIDEITKVNENGE